MIQGILITPMGSKVEVSAREWADQHIESAKSFVNEQGQAVPVFLFLAPDPEQEDHIIQGIIPLMDFLTADNREELYRKKGLMATILRSVLEQTEAIASLFISETWMKKGTEGQSLEELRKQAGEGLEHIPGRTEGLMIIFETRTDYESCVWEIQRDDEGNPSVGGEGEKMDRAEGRLVSFLHSTPSGPIN